MMRPEIRVAVPYHFYAGLDPAFHFNADPNPDPAFYLNSDPENAPHQIVANLQPLVSRPSMAPF